MGKYAHKKLENIMKVGRICDVKKKGSLSGVPLLQHGDGENLNVAQLQMGARNGLQLHKIRHVFDVFFVHPAQAKHI
jgi:hypothetical protein